MSNRTSEKDKKEYNTIKLDNNSIKENNSTNKNRKFSNPKLFINSKYHELLQTRRLPELKRNKNYFNYDINKEKVLSQISYRRNNSNNNNIFDLTQKQKEKLIREINQSNNELKTQDKELKKYQTLYGSIRKENLENQFLLYQLINKEKEKNKNKEKSCEDKKKNKSIETEKEIIIKDQISTHNNIDKNSISNKDEKNSISNFDTHSFFLTGTNINYDKGNKTNYTNFTNKAKSKSNIKKNKTFISTNYYKTKK